MKDKNLGKPLIDKSEDHRKKAIKKEKDFAKSVKDPDILKKRTDSDLFKGGW